MERKFANVGPHVEPDPGLVPNITHAATDTELHTNDPSDLFGEASRALKKGCGRGWERVQKQTDEVISYARKEPVTAMTAAASVGFLVGLAVLAIGSRASSGGGRAWLPQLNSRRSFLGRRAGSGWRGLLGHS